MSKQIISSENLELEIDTLGARITKLSTNGQEIMKKSKDDLQGYNGMLLAPWPNRIRDGIWESQGVTQQLEINEKDRNNALHGFAYKTEFEITNQTAAEITLQAVLGEITGYPFSIEIEINYQLKADEFICSTTATNKSSSPAPFGIAFHPYFPADAETKVSIPAKTHLLTDQQMIPIASEANSQQNFIFGEVDFDDCFSELERTDGIAELTIHYPDRQITLWQDEAFDYVMVFTTNAFDSIDGSTQAIAIEAQSCLANAFNTEPPLLEPGESFIGSWGLTLGGR